jgi:hypothetical protein
LTLELTLLLLLLLLVVVVVITNSCQGMTSGPDFLMDLMAECNKPCCRLDMYLPWMASTLANARNLPGAAAVRFPQQDPSGPLQPIAKDVISGRWMHSTDVQGG